MRLCREDLREYLQQVVRELAEQFSNEELESFKVVARKTNQTFSVFVENSLPDRFYSFQAVIGGNCRKYLKDNLDRDLFKLVGDREENIFINTVNSTMAFLIDREINSEEMREVA